jgi:hypothetical protein
MVITDQALNDILYAVGVFRAICVFSLTSNDRSYRGMTECQNTQGSEIPEYKAHLLRFGFYNDTLCSETPTTQCIVCFT